MKSTVIKVNKDKEINLAELKPFYRRVVAKQIKLGKDTWFIADVCRAIEDMLETHENDMWGQYSMREYELEAPIEIYEYFQYLGLFKHYIGERQAELWCLAEGAEEKVRQIYQYINEESLLMPKYCYECNNFDGETGFCRLLGHGDKFDEDGARFINCPYNK